MTEKNVHPGAWLTVDEDRRRAELWDTLEGRPTFIGFIGYAPETVAGRDVLRLQHTIVHPQYGRRGYARCLVTLMMERIRENGELFVSECTYIDAYLRRYPEYRAMQSTAG